VIRTKQKKATLTYLHYPDTSCVRFFLDERDLISARPGEILFLLMHNTAYFIQVGCLQCFDLVFSKVTSFFQHEFITVAVKFDPVSSPFGVSLICMTRVLLPER